MYKKLLLGVFISVVFVLLSSHSAFAGTLGAISDTVSTSRPSASAPLNTDQAASAGQVTIVDNNAFYLASDSATIYADPVGGGETTNTSLNVASMSAQISGTPNTRIIYFTNTAANIHHKGDAVVVPITAMHTVKFTPSSTIPSGGKIVINFPSTNVNDTNQASPSAQTFMFNGLTNSLVQVNNVTCSSITVTSGSAGSTSSISCTTGGVVSGGTVVTFLIGCSSASGSSCTTQAPHLINPMKTSTNSLSGQGAGTTQADNLKVSVHTEDTPGNGGSTLDTGTAVVGIIESVQVQANIDPTLTFQLIGVSDGTTINNSFVSGCPNTTSDIANSGIASTATNVNLGTVGTGLTIAVQKAIVSTNGTGGYSLTATSSGKLMSTSSGYSIVSNTTPAAIIAGTENFGIHPCGSDVSNATTVWNNGGNGTQASLKSGSGFVGWPLTTTAVQLASHIGAINNATTAVEYGITASGTTPAGTYTSVITYVATPTFN